MPQWQQTDLMHVLDLMGTAAFAFSGALRSLPKRPDMVGMTILAGATAIGGGLVRDVVLQRPTPILADASYPLVILLSVAVAFFFPGRLLRHEKFFQYFDAVGLGVFSAIGAGLAMDKHLNPLSVLFVAAITGAGGGIIRDVLCIQMPLVLYREIYILAVLAGAGALLAVRWLGGSQDAAFVVAMALTTAIRVLAIRFGWRLPRVNPLGGES